MTELIHCPFPLDRLLPLKPPMILLQEPIGYADDRFCAGLSIQSDTLFLQESGVPSYIALEYMAQTAGAMAGLFALLSGKPVSIGLLLGTRNFHTSRNWYRIGDRLTIFAETKYHDEEMGAVACKVMVEGDITAEAQLNLYRPKDALQFFSSEQS